MRTILIVILFLLFPVSAFSYYGQIDSEDEIIQYLVINSNGIKTGYDPVLKRKIEQDPYIHYGMFATSSPDGDRLVSYQWVGVRPDGTSDKITIVTTGLKLSVYSISISFNENNDYSSTTYKESEIKGFADIGNSNTFEVSYVPFQPLTVVRVSTGTSFISDITTASKLGYIGNAKFVNELIKEVQEIEKERTEVRKQDDKEKEHLTPVQKAIKGYKELLKEITEKYQRPEGDEFVKQEAYTVLKEDLDYIIGHIQ